MKIDIKTLKCSYGLVEISESSLSNGFNLFQSLLKQQYPDNV